MGVKAPSLALEADRFLHGEVYVVMRERDIHAVAAERLEADEFNDLCIVSLVWIDPGCAALAKEGTLDKADMYKNNYDATKLAIKRALNDEPSHIALMAALVKAYL